MSTTTISTPGGRVFRLYADLAKLPHLLIAGATGSGKSVTVNGIIYALLATKAPSECSMVLIDPKKVELVQYARLPHTLRYASEPRDMIDALDFAVKETTRRFSIMQLEGKKAFSGPDLYVIIDELADLMTTQKNHALPRLQRRRDLPHGHHHRGNGVKIQSENASLSARLHRQPGAGF